MDDFLLQRLFGAEINKRGDVVGYPVMRVDICFHPKFCRVDIATFLHPTILSFELWSRNRANDALAEGHVSWKTHDKLTLGEAGKKAKFKIIPGNMPQRPDFSEYKMVLFTPQALTDALQKAKHEKGQTRDRGGVE